MSLPRDSHAYDDIIDLPHPVSTKHPQMPLRDRAAQFSPFAALSGYEDAVHETARLTGQRVELGEDAKAELELRMTALAGRSSAHPQVMITYFVQDPAKEGGEYRTVTQAVKRVDETERRLLLMDGGKIPLEDILWIEEPAAGPQP